MEHVAYREISNPMTTAVTCSSRERRRNRGCVAVEISKPVTDEGQQSVSCHSRQSHNVQLNCLLADLGPS